MRKEEEDSTGKAVVINSGVVVEKVIIAENYPSQIMIENGDSLITFNSVIKDSRLNALQSSISNMPSIEGLEEEGAKRMELENAQILSLYSEAYSDSTYLEDGIFCLDIHEFEAWQQQVESVIKEQKTKEWEADDAAMKIKISLINRMDENKYGKHNSVEVVLQNNGSEQPVVPDEVHDDDWYRNHDIKNPNSN